MKKKYLLIPIVILAMVVMFGAVACKDPPESGSSTLRGTVSIPSEVMIGMPITANTDALAGSGAISYQWQTSNSATGTFTDIAGATSNTFGMTAQAGVIEEGRFLRVTVERDGREGSVSSNAAEIYDTVLITGVTINFPSEGVTAGTTYTNLTATVTYSFENKTDKFQDVRWSVEGKNSPQTIINEQTGVLVIGANETASSITVKAVSIFNNDISDTKNLAVGATALVLELDPIVTIEARLGNPLEAAAVLAKNGGRPAAHGTIANPAGTGTVFYVENCKTTIETGTLEIYFALDEVTDISAYNWLSYEITADNYEILDDITGHYPRFLHLYPTFVQYEINPIWRMAIMMELQGQLPGKWATVTMQLATSGFHAGAPNYQICMEELHHIGLRYITEGTPGLPGKIYFRNLKLHINQPTP